MATLRTSLRREGRPALGGLLQVQITTFPHKGNPKMKNFFQKIKNAVMFTKKNTVNIYAAWKNTEGKMKYYKVGLNYKRGEPRTLFVTSKSDYEKAKTEAEKRRPGRSAK